MKCKKMLFTKAPMEKIGALASTKPDVDSALSSSLKTTCKRNGDVWTLRGQKKLIGNATSPDLIIVRVKEEDDHQVKGFIVDREIPVLINQKSEDKKACRNIESALITLNGCKVKEERRLQKTDLFRNAEEVLKKIRAVLALQAVSCREVTSKARKMVGVVGILILNKEGRFLGDAKALYSYEGTKQIKGLFVERPITGMSAFT